MNIATLITLSIATLSTPLPEGYNLQKNSSGDIYLTNPKQVTIIDPKILSFGYNKDYFIACIKNNHPHMELKRYVIVNFNNGSTIDTVNINNWEYFIQKIPALTEVKVNQISNEQCP